MVFHWNLSNSKCPQVSRIRLSILADLNNAIVWMVFIHPLISKSSSPFINPSVTVSRAPIIIGINVPFMFHSFFNSLARSRYLSFFLVSFNFTLWSAGTVESSILHVLFFVDYYMVWLSGRDSVIRFYVKIPLAFVCLIRIVQFTFLAQFPMDHPANPGVSSLILFQC